MAQCWILVAVIFASFIAWRLPLLEQIFYRLAWSKASCSLAFPIRVAESSQDYGELGCNHSISHDDIRLAGKRYTVGIATHANARIQFEPIPVSFTGSHFAGLVGLSDHVVYVGGSTVASIWINGIEKWRSRRLVAGVIDSFLVAVTPGDAIELIVEDAGDGIHSDEVAWIDLRIQ